jgi:hypothetical protein
MGAEIDAMILLAEACTGTAGLVTLIGKLNVAYRNEKIEKSYRKIWHPTPENGVYLLAAIEWELSTIEQDVRLMNCMR